MFLFFYLILVASSHLIWIIPVYMPRLIYFLRVHYYIIIYCFLPYKLPIIYKWFIIINLIIILINLSCYLGHSISQIDFDTMERWMFSFLIRINQGESIQNGIFNPFTNEYHFTTAMPVDNFSNAIVPYSDTESYSVKNNYLTCKYYKAQTRLHLEQFANKEDYEYNTFRENIYNNNYLNSQYSNIHRYNYNTFDRCIYDTKPPITEYVCKNSQHMHLFDPKFNKDIVTTYCIKVYVNPEVYVDYWSYPEIDPYVKNWFLHGNFDLKPQGGLTYRYLVERPAQSMSVLPIHNPIPHLNPATMKPYEVLEYFDKHPTYICYDYGMCISKHVNIHNSNEEFLYNNIGQRVDPRHYGYKIMDSGPLKFLVRDFPVYKEDYTPDLIYNPSTHQDGVRYRIADALREAHPRVWKKELENHHFHPEQRQYMIDMFRHNRIPIKTIDAVDHIGGVKITTRLLHIIIGPQPPA